jgi:hypothetical protein
MRHIIRYILLFFKKCDNLYLPNDIHVDFLIAYWTLHHLSVYWNITFKEKEIKYRLLHFYRL